jgi:hypothetical protein
MTMRVKVYVVSEKIDETETVIAVRMTWAAAWSVAKLAGNRRVQKFFASKSHEPDTGSTNGGAKWPSTDSQVTKHLITS